MVQVWTGRIGEGGSSEVNTTYKSADTVIGKLLAPSKQIVLGHKHYSGDKRFRSYPKVSDEAYRRRYLEGLRMNFAAHQDMFRELLERDTLTLTCYCAKHKSFCHRYILARYVLPRCARYFGIDYIYRGER